MTDEIQAFCGIRDRKTMRRLFAELFTPAECRDIALRWRLMGLLAGGVSQRAIARDLGVSLCKITRGAKVLRNPGSITGRLLHTGLLKRNLKRRMRHG